MHDFTGVDATYDALLALGLRPVVELSYMPRDLASDPDVTVFDYGAIVSPPKDWDRWAALITDLVQHLVDRYGLDEVRVRWSFEVWNEPNLEVFWSGTRDEFWRLYDVTVNAVRAVDDQLVVGGPSTAAAGWVDGLLEHVASSGAPVDFVSTHTYGNAPLDVRATLARHGREDAQIWWTEWGVSPTHFGNANDGVFSAAFLVRGMRSAAGRIDALSYWVVSDQFEELGRPPRLLHGGFGLRTVGELRKPRWWALWLLEQLGRDEVAATVTGDGADSLVEVWASRDERPRRRRPLERHARPVARSTGPTRWPAPPTCRWTACPTGRGWCGSRGSTPTTRTSRPCGRRCPTAPTGRPTSSGRRCARPTSSPSRSDRWTGRRSTSTCPTRRSC